MGFRVIVKNVGINVFIVCISQCVSKVRIYLGKLEDTKNNV